jgi:arsenite-transporting ATPase
MNCSTEYIFYLGKGGVGKSTLSALSALKLSCDVPVLLVSLDPAHNQSDIFVKKFSEKPILVNKNLLVKEIDMDKWIRKYMKEIEEQMRKTYAYFTAFNLEKHFGLIKYSPGIEEYILISAFNKIREQFADKKYIIFDMPPTALALKFLRLPSISLLWIEQLLSLRKEIISKQEMITKVKFGKREFELDKVLNKLTQQTEFYTELQQTFRNLYKTKINLVLNPDELSLAESKRIVEKLQKIGINVSALFINKVMNNNESGDIRKAFPNYPVEIIPVSKTPPIGIKVLEEFISKITFNHSP